MSNKVYVCAKYGNDCKGELENPAKPFKTVNAACKALKGEAGWNVMVQGNGPYYEGDLQVPGGTTIKGEGEATVIVGTVFSQICICIHPPNPQPGPLRCNPPHCDRKKTFSDLTLQSYNTPVIGPQRITLNGSYNINPSGNNIKFERCHLQSTWTNGALEQDTALVNSNLEINNSKVTITSFGGGKVNRSRQINGNFVEFNNVNNNEVHSTTYLTLQNGIKATLDGTGMQIWTTNGNKIKAMSGSFLCHEVGTGSKVKFYTRACNEADGKEYKVVSVRTGYAMIATQIDNSYTYHVVPYTPTLGLAQSTTYKQTSNNAEFITLASGQDANITPQMGTQFYRAKGNNKIIFNGDHLYVVTEGINVTIESEFYFITKKGCRSHELQLEKGVAVSIWAVREWNCCPIKYYRWKIDKGTGGGAVPAHHIIKSNTSNHLVPSGYSTFNTNVKDTASVPICNNTIPIPNFTSYSLPTPSQSVANQSLTCLEIGDDVGIYGTFSQGSLINSDHIIYQIKYSSSAVKFNSVIEGIGPEVPVVYLKKGQVVNLLILSIPTNNNQVYNSFYSRPPHTSITQTAENHNVGSTSNSTVITLKANSSLSGLPITDTNFDTITNTNGHNFTLDTANADGLPQQVSLINLGGNNSIIFWDGINSAPLTPGNGFVFNYKGSSVGYAPTSLQSQLVQTASRISLGDNPGPFTGPNQTAGCSTSIGFPYDQVTMFSGDVLNLCGVPENQSPKVNYPLTITICYQGTSGTASVTGTSPPITLSPTTPQWKLTLEGTVTGLGTYVAQQSQTVNTPSVQSNNMVLGSSLRTRPPLPVPPLPHPFPPPCPRCRYVTDTLVIIDHPTSLSQFDNVVSNSQSKALQVKVPQIYESSHRQMKVSTFDTHLRGGDIHEKILQTSEDSVIIPNYIGTIQLLSATKATMSLITGPEATVDGAVVHGTRINVNNAINNPNTVVLSAQSGQIFNLDGFDVPTINVCPGQNFTLHAQIRDTTNYWKVTSKAFQCIS